jgi:hypothetical protein
MEDVTEQAGKQDVKAVLHSTTLARQPTLTQAQAKVLNALSL